MGKDATGTLRKLKEGNARYLSQELLPPHPHAPRYAVLACADARVDPARIFDAEPGALFVVRTAGNVAPEEVREALAFAAELGVEAIVVLGHTDCGAIKDALAAEPSLPKTAARIRANLSGETDPSEAARAHARATAAELARALAGRVPVAAALYRTERGEVEWL